MDLQAFVSKTLSLLEKERSAEIEETLSVQENCSNKELEQRGVCILKLRITSHSSGLYGRTVLVFEAYWPGKPFPAHNITSGDIVGLSLSKSDQGNETISSGIVSRVEQAAVHVAFDETLDQQDLDSDQQYKLVKLANDVTYKRLKRGLNELREYRGERCGRLIDVLFGEIEPGPPFSQARDGDDVVSSDISWYNDRLDESQREAVKFALGQREVAIIHGPPGTGKTTTVVEIILQAIRQGLKVLTCASSNIAVDNLVERLAKYKTKMVRLGHPARLLPQIQHYALDAVVSHSDETQVVKTVRTEMDQALKAMRKNNNRGEKQRLRAELRDLRKDLREREAAAISQVLKRCDVILATLATSGDGGPLKHVKEDHFDLVVIDECSQSLEAACWISLPRAPKCILAGDHLQLPPTIVSHEAAKEGLEVTLMERLLKLYPGVQIVRMLTTQYRMHEDIMKWPSDQLYESKLTAHSSVKSHLLRDLPGVYENEETSIPVLMIDTAGCDLQELNVPDELSKANEGEVDLACVHIEKLLQSGLPEDEIAVIAPYNLQVELLRLKLCSKYPRLEIKSVDGFQGREKEAVVITLVRSNDKREVGFLAEDRRINVAITRARRHLAVICDSETVGNHTFLKDMVNYILENGEVRSAQQYIEDGAIDSTANRPDYLQAKLDAGAKREEKAKSKGAKIKSKGANAKEKSAKNKSQTSLETKRKPAELNRNHYRGPKSKNNQSDDLEDMLKRLKKEMDDFVAEESRTRLEFPSTFNSHQRLQVHEMAEKIGLNHISQGEGKERYVVVSKPIEAASNSEPDELPSEYISTENVLRSENSYEKRISTERSTICGKCKKGVPAKNMQLHHLRCRTPPPPKAAKVQDVRPKSTKPGKRNRNKGNKTVPEEDDFDTLIAKAMKENSTCAFVKCKALTATLGQNCEFCAKRFCLEHHIPEVHGCGTEAKTRARKMISREGVLYSGSGIPSKKPDPNKRAHLQRKLDSKLEEMTQKRTLKKKDTNS